MKLFSMPGTCAVSVAIVLHWIEHPFELVLMSPGQNRAPDYLAINPSGQVPALQLDDGRVLTEAAAILPYLAATHPEARLDIGSHPDEAFRLARMMSYLTSELHVAVKPHFTPQRFLDDPDQFPALRARAWAILGPMLEMLDKTLDGIVRPTGYAMLSGLSVLANSSGSFLDALWSDLREGGQRG